MTRSLTRLLPIAALGLIPMALASVTPPVAAPLPHPHFPKTLICAIPNGPTITVKHLTVTFDREGAKKMAAGQAWHLAGATFATDKPLVVGGREMEAGTYALSARKAASGWELTLHDGKGFSRPGEDVQALETEFVAKSPRYEHLSCDIQPGGDKQNTQLFLDVRFDEMLARCLIELPTK